jgi:hypothetical protein
MQNVLTLLDGSSMATNVSVNSSNASNGHQVFTSTSLPFFPSGLSAIAMVLHLATHPKIKDWLQLVLLGLVAALTRMASKNVKTWLRYTFCTTSVHLMNDESYDWLMGKFLHICSSRNYPQGHLMRYISSILASRYKVGGEMQRIVRPISFSASDPGKLITNTHLSAIAKSARSVATSIFALGYEALGGHPWKTGTLLPIQGSFRLLVGLAVRVMLNDSG